MGSLPHPNKNVFQFQKVKTNEKEISVEKKWNGYEFAFKTMLNTKFLTCETYRKA